MSSRGAPWTRVNNHGGLKPNGPAPLPSSLSCKSFMQGMCGSKTHDVEKGKCQWVTDRTNPMHVQGMTAVQKKKGHARNATCTIHVTGTFLYNQGTRQGVVLPGRQNCHVPPGHQYCRVRTSVLSHTAGPSVLAGTAGTAVQWYCRGPRLSCETRMQHRQINPNCHIGTIRVTRMALTKRVTCQGALVTRPR